MSDQQESLQQPFSEAVLSEATTIGESIKTALLGRVEVSGITINGPLTKACNMAIWLERSFQGGYTLLISIVDVGSFISLHQTPALDNEAYARAFAHHTDEKVFVPLLPDSLAEGSLSLLEGLPCPTLTLSLPLDASFHRGEPSFLQQTFVRNHKQFTYEEIDHALADKQSEFSFLFQDAFRLALILWRSRLLQGASAMYDLETGWVTTEDGVRILLTEDKRYKGYIIAQEFLILANQTIASYLAARGLPALYRNHRTKAIYAPTIDGHVGLQVPVYTHATHPLRSYPDLINQRIFLAALRGEPSPYTMLELEARADPLNTKEAIIKATKRGHFRSEYDEQLQKQREEKSLPSLDQKQFHSVIRKTAEEQLLTSEIVLEIYRRLEEHLLKGNDLFTLVFRFQNSDEEWDRIKQAVCRFFQKNPAQAAMIYNSGLQMGKWNVLRYEERLDFLGRFQAQVVIHYEGQEYMSSFHTASRKDRAKHLALADVLATIAGVVLPPEVPKLEPWEEDVSDT